MAISALSLPLDIPWKRLCISEDMLDPSVCDRVFPHRWRSSVAVFSYEPAEEHQTYAGQTISYLKVVCTITGFQPDPEEVGIRDRRADAYWNDPVVIEDFKNLVAKYYACYGAILEVAVGPPSDVTNLPLGEYPYFADFEPKKREIYEIVSESGETMSRTLESLNVHKGATTTETHEVLDMTTWGVTADVGAGVPGGVQGSVGASYQNQSGTRDITQEQRANTQTSDRGREMRELYSHTTQLTQMYQQFTSYHLGTNRAVFFMLPRPHIKQSKRTFVNGPRKLEGIQEVFLVVMRPKRLERFCVEAYLETAHRHIEMLYERATNERTFILRGVRQLNHTHDVTGVWLPDDNWEIDVGRDGGYVIESHTYPIEVVEVDRDHLTATMTLPGWSKAQRDEEGRVHPPPPVQGTIRIFVRERNGTIDAGTRTDLWLTGRGVCCCADAHERELGESVVFETPLDQIISPRELPGLDQWEIAVLDANRMRDQIGDTMLDSLNHPERYPAGTVKFLDTQFAGRRIARHVEAAQHPDDTPVTKMPGLEPGIAKRVEAARPGASRAWLLKMPLAEQMDRFGLTVEEARKLRRAALNLAGPPLDPKDRWDPPAKRRSEGTVPDVTGLSLDAARSAIEAALLTVGDVTVRDSDSPSQSVLNQYPEAGARAARLAPVDLVVASGAIVRIPEVVGNSISQALVRLRQAGLVSEPRLIFARSAAAHGLVVDVTPGTGEYVTPHADVVLQVSTASGT
jgi:hypothetical protein